LRAKLRIKVASKNWRGAPKRGSYKSQSVWGVPWSTFMEGGVVPKGGESMGGKVRVFSF